MFTGWGGKMPEREGVVTDLAAPAAGRKMATAKVGGRTVRFFWTDMNSENPTVIRQRLEKAQREAFPVTVTGEEMPNPRGEGNPMFKVLEVARVPQGAPAASQAPQNGSQSPPAEKHFVGRDPGMADFWLATRWAWSLAAELIAKTGKEASVSAIAELAGEIFQASYSEALKHKEWAAQI